MLGFKGYLPFPLSPTPRSKRELGQPLLSREYAQLRGRGWTENRDSPFLGFCHVKVLYLPCAAVIDLLLLFSSVVRKVGQYMADVLEDSRDKVQENLLANGGKLS